MQNGKKSTLSWEKITRRRRLFGVGLALIAGLALTGLLRPGRDDGNRNTSSGAPSDPVNLDVVTLDAAALRNVDLTLATAERRKFVQTKQVTGSVGPNETRVSHLRPLARGRIDQVYVRLGDRVRAGRPLLTYDNIELGDLIGDFAKAKANVEVAQKSLERARRLVDLGAVARGEMERRQAEYKSTFAGMRAILKKLHRFGMTDEDIDRLSGNGTDQGHHDVSHTILRAPFDGAVIAYDVSRGEAVSPDRELLTVADLSTVWVQADVYEKDIAVVHEGQRATVSVDAYPGEIFAGTITNVSDFLDPATRTAKVRCEVPNPEGRLKLEMFAVIHIPASMGHESVMIPASAVQRIDDRPVVFVELDEGRFQKREVRLGVTEQAWVEVISGVSAGEVVAARGSFYVKSTLQREHIGGEE